MTRARKVAKSKHLARVGLYAGIALAGFFFPQWFNLLAPWFVTDWFLMRFE